MTTEYPHGRSRLGYATSQESYPTAEKTAAPAKVAVQATAALRHLAAEWADSHELPKKQAEAVLGDLVTLAARHLKKGHKTRQQTSEVGDWKMPDFKAACSFAVSRGWLVVQGDALALTAAALRAV
jgi:hypothetical protein